MLKGAVARQIEKPKPVPTAHLRRLAVWCGLVAGLIEGLWLYVSHGLGWLTPEILAGVSLEIIWISAVVNLLVFFLLALTVSFAGRLFPRISNMRLCLFVCVFCATADWAGSSGRISSLGTVVFAAGLGIFLSRKLVPHAPAILSFCRRTLPAVMALTIVAFVGIEGGYWLKERHGTRILPSAAPGSPNVLVIVVDTLRADHLAAYGYSRPTSPFMDQVARQGALFEHAVSTSSWTLPSHQSMLTGRYPHEIGPLREQPLTSRFPTLGEVMQKRGYRTAAFSANTLYFCRRAGFSRGFLHFEDYFYSLGDMFYRTLWGRLLFRGSVASVFGLDELPRHRLASDVNRSLFKWLDHDRTHPFFAVLNYFDVHYPYVPPQPYRTKFDTAAKKLKCSIEATQILSPLYFWNMWKQFSHLSPECFQQQVNRYDGGISYVDDQIRWLFSELSRRGLDQNTVVVITSDHGESFREHGLVFHGTSLYLEQIHIPLIYWAPGRIPAGRRVSEPVTIASLPATILSLLGDEAQKTFPGPSLAELWGPLRSAAQNFPDPISELVQDRYVPKETPVYKGWMKSVLSSEWHLVVSETLPTELYNWPHDVAEAKDLARDGQNSQLIKQLREKLWRQASPGSSASFSARRPAAPQQANRAHSNASEAHLR